MSRIVALVGLAMALALVLPGNTEAANLNEIKKLVASDAEADDWFGRSVSVSGDTVIVGANFEDHPGAVFFIVNGGAAYVYQRNHGGADSWGEVKKLIASDSQPHDHFGHAVAVSGDTAIVGARSEDTGGSNAGAAYVFQRDQGGPDNWGEVTKLTAADAHAGDEFGRSVAVSGNTILVGALAEDAAGIDAGAVYVFERNEGGADNWGQVAKLTASDAQTEDFFGVSVAVSGDNVIVGASSEDAGGSDAGAGYVFQRNQGGADSWGEVTKLTASDAQNGDFFGASVAVEGDSAIVGASSEDAGGSNAGAGYVFQRDEGGANNWGEVTKLTASDAQPEDEFGASVAISGASAIVGAPVEAVGGPFAGAAYAFERDQGGVDNWGEVTKITASDAQAVDFFGNSVAVSGDTAVAGALWEDAGGDLAGAAYVFDLLLPKPTATPRPTSGPLPVGGIALDAELRALPLETGDPDGYTWGVLSTIIVTASLAVAGGAAWYARRRSLS